MKLSNIYKLQSGGGISNTRYNDTHPLETYWSNMAASNIYDQIDVNNMDEFNKRFGNYYDLRRSAVGQGYKYGSDPTYSGDKVQDYQQWFDSKGGHTATYKDSDGNDQQAWVWADTGQRNTGDWIPDEGKSFTGDNYFGDQTYRRTINYFTNKEVTDINNKLKSKGIEFVLDDRGKEFNDTGTGRQMYYLRKIGDPNRPSPDGPIPGDDPLGGNPGGTPQGPEGGNNGKVYNFENTSKFKYPGWSDWIPLTMNKIIGDYWNKRQLNTALKIKAPLDEFTPEYYKARTAYGTRQLLQNAKQQAIANSQNNAFGLSSNLDTQATNALTAFQAADQYDDKEAALYNQTVDTDLNKVQAVTNANNKGYTQVANANRKALAAIDNYKLDAKQKWMANKTALAQKYNTDMYTNASSYLNEKQKAFDIYNRNNAELEYTKTFNNLTQQKNAQIDALLKNPDTISAFKSLLQTKINDSSITAEEAEELETFMTQLPVLLQSASGRATIKEKFKEYPIVQSWYENATESIEDNYQNGLNQADLKRQSVVKPYGTPTSGQMGWFGGRWWNQKTEFKKKGGKIDELKAFISNSQRERERVGKESLQRNKQIDDKLRQDLGELSKEQILLLRAIFK